MTQSLVPLTAQLIKPAAIAGARAFADDPSTAYLIPSPKKRPSLRHAFEYSLRLSLLERAEAYVTSPHCEGLAIWARSDTVPSFSDSLRAGWPWRVLRCGWTYILRDARIERHYNRLRRELAPETHLYLALLAVDPEFQSRGFASKLIRPILMRLDAEKMPAYVETQNLRNAAMYEHYGFRLTKEDALPGTSLKMYLMTRFPVV